MKNKQIFIHIGTDKTGSTAIQSFLKLNREVLASKGVSVITAGGFDHHHGPLRHELAEGKLDLLNQVVEEVRSGEAKKYLLTHEGFYNLPPSAVVKFLAALADFELRPLIYLRRRSDKARSWFAQTMKLDNYGRADPQLLTGRFDIDLPNLDYRKILERWDKALSDIDQSAQLVVRTYEKSSFTGAGVIEDFLSATGILDSEGDLAGAGFRPLDGEANPSIGPTSQYLMALTRAFGLPKETRKKVMQLLRQHETSGERKLSMIPDALARELDDRYSEDDQWLARKYFGRDTLFRDPPVFREGAPQPERLFEFVKTICEAGQRLQLKPWNGKVGEIERLSAQGVARIESGRAEDRFWERITLVPSDQLLLKGGTRLCLQFAEKQKGKELSISVFDPIGEVVAKSEGVELDLSSVMSAHGLLELKATSSSRSGPILRTLKIAS